ncbi:MAG: [protein-PII] uridylyltransferase [Deltaproteobacteria bacterium RBG_16_54_11]|nr:MAG: [protein-PII] uridylyltransferase [Deltaproteobacteria bacterium RBG_16_54_11]
MEYSAAQLKTSRQQLITLFTDGLNTKSFPEENTALIDQYFQDSLPESHVGRTLLQQGIPFAFIALGGYGRRELCLHSDIDTLLLFGKKVPSQAKTLVQEILFPLWDLGLDLGYGTRTIKDCLRIAKIDFEVLTSLLDARFIGGEYPLYLDLIEKLYKKVVTKKARDLHRWLAEQDKKRLETFGDSSYLLEPNLKEGIGGLRDYHHMLWLAKASFGPRETHEQAFRARLSYQEYQDLRQHVSFLLNIRNHLHLRSLRKNDRLTFEDQEEIANRLGLRDKKTSLAAEQFNELVHATMAALKSLSRSFIGGLFATKKKRSKIRQMPLVPRGLVVDGGELCFDTVRTIIKNPSLLMIIFEHSALLGYALSLEARRIIREFLYLVDDSFRRSKTIINSFIKIVTQSNCAFETLSQMMEIGFLDSFIPEFGRIHNRVEFDAYHIYPVGIHSLQTIRYLKSLTEEKDILLRDLFVELQHPERLFLAGLFHDIGKIGSDHARRGTKITKNILKRFGLTDDAIEDICFLVRSHLLLAETATRRDLNDEKVIVQCARMIGSLERLKLLYLLTWADSRATGPKAWNDWIANLISELFFKVLHIMESKELATQDALSRVEHVKAEVHKKVGPIIERQDLENSFELMPPRYLLNTHPRKIVQHLGMAESLKAKKQANETKSGGHAGDEVFIFESREDKKGNCWEITIVAIDRPGLFANMAGVLALNAINILSADIYTWRDGTAVDVLRTTNPLDGLFVQEKWAKGKEDLKNVLAGRLSLESSVGNEETPRSPTGLKKLARKPTVIVDNESSDFFTIIEVYSHDHVVLLYRITHTLFDLGLDIHSARIAAAADQVVDVFYVRDLEGQKIEDVGRVKEIKRILLKQLKPL